MQKKYMRVLTIAGFDPSGGAGLQADLKVFTTLGCYGATVLTALPVQNTTGVQSVYEIPLQCIEGQLHAVLSDIGTDVVKIGMLYSVEIIELVARILTEYQVKKIVLDPVMVAKSGHRLLKPQAVEALKSLLLPMATVITPNIPEAEDLLSVSIEGRDAMLVAAQRLQAMGCECAIVKGGHAGDATCVDVLCDASGFELFTSKRIHTINTHGTGCSFSAAIASYLAHGCSVREAVSSAKGYITEAITSGAHYSIGSGHGPVNHLFQCQPIIHSNAY